MINHGVNMNLDDQRQEHLKGSSPFFNLMVNEVVNLNGSDFERKISPHWHRELEAFCLLEGQVQIGAADRLFTLTQGQGCLINSSVLHSFYFSEGRMRFRSFLFDSGIVAGAPGSLFDSVYTRPFLESGPVYLKFIPGQEDGGFFQAFQNIFSLCNEEPEGYELGVRGALSQIMLLAKQKSKLLPSRKMAAAQELRIKHMLSWIEEHLQEAVTVEDIAGQGSICVRACQKAFRQYLHCTPIEYLQRRRIHAAARQLSLTNDPVTEIAMEYGFSSPSYFSKRFKEETGCSPSQYREAALHYDHENIR